MTVKPELAIDPNAAIKINKNKQIKAKGIKLVHIHWVPQLGIELALGT